MNKLIVPQKFQESEASNEKRLEVEILELNYSLDSNRAKLPPKLIIDPEFKSLIPAQKPEERQLLEENLLQYGCREAIVVWKQTSPEGTIERILLDGHNRLELCTFHNIPYQIAEIELSAREAAINWILRNQLGRRNLTPESASYYRGKLYNQLKKQGQRTDLTSRQSDDKLDTELLTSRQSDDKLSKQLAAQYRVGARTIERDGSFAIDIDSLAEILGNDARNEILSRRKKLTKKTTAHLASAAIDYPEVVLEAFTENSQGKEMVKTLNEKLRQIPTEPFPFQIGQAVLVTAVAERSLRPYQGYWGIVRKIYDSNECDVQIWSKILKVRPENLTSSEIPSGQWQAAEAIVSRLAKLKGKQLESIAIANLIDISKRPVTKLTELEENILNLLENKYKSEF
ncbi:MAG: hypothetical protein QNJ54_20045 [Prochloraceae cyanobacterium]|nr:hypothetical protein [Prochloraceae cyanobacterium]